MAKEILVNWDRFYFSALRFDGAQLTLACDDGGEAKGEIICCYVRLFVHFRESDMYPEMAKYQTRDILLTRQKDLGVFEITSGSMLLRQLAGRLDEESPGAYLIATPQECLEVVAFEEPSFRVF